MWIDVSKYQGDIDWAKVKNAGVDAVIIRCYIEGEDRKFKSNIEGAIAQDIKVGVYCYSKAKSEAEGRTEAKNTAKVIAPYKDKLYFPVFLDLEEDGTGEYSKKVISGFCKEINEQGYNAGIYCSSGWRSSYLRGVNADYWWIADYRGKQPDNCCIWQYSRKGRIDGINADVDLDMNISYNPDPKPEPTQTTVDMILQVLIPNKSTGGNVKAFQRIMRELGYKDQNGELIEVDGDYGKKSAYVCENFQRGTGIPVTGIVDYETWLHVLN